MAVGPHAIRCPRCGLVNTAGIASCKACGLSLGPASGGAASAAPPAIGPLLTIPTAVHTSNPTAGSPGAALPVRVSAAGGSAPASILASLLGWTTFSGVVLHVDPPYMARPEFSWPRFLVKGGLLVLFFPLILGVVVGAFVISAISSVLGFGRRGPGFISGLASQVIGFFLTSKLLGPKADVPVRDVRLRDSGGNEHLVRIRGEVTIGNVNPGDDVTVEGFNRGGTLMFWRGRNHRTNSEIRVKHR